MFFINNYIKLIRLASKSNFIGQRIANINTNVGCCFSVKSVPVKRRLLKVAGGLLKVSDSVSSALTPN